MEGPTEHSSGSNSVVGQNLHLPPGSVPPSSVPSAATVPTEKSRGRKRTRTQVSRKPTSFLFLAEIL